MTAAWTDTAGPGARLRFSNSLPTKSPVYDRLVEDSDERTPKQGDVFWAIDTAGSASTMSTEIKHSSKAHVWQREFWLQTGRDIKHFPWRWLALSFLTHVLPVLIIVLLLVLVILMSVIPDLFISGDEGGCSPDGDYEMTYDTSFYTPWTSNSVWAINIKFGSYSFAIAKMIDVVWAMAMGRGGQCLLALLSYRIFMKAITYMMERSSLRHQTFKAATLENTTVYGLWSMTIGLWTTKGLRAKISILWIVGASVFILFTPTWLNALSGYTADVSLYVQDRNGLLVPAANFLPVIYTIHDGARLGDGFTNITRLTVPWSSGGFSISTTDLYGCSSFSNIINSAETTITFRPNTDQSCKWLWSISRYVNTYGLLGKSHTMNTTLLRPSDDPSIDNTSLTPFDPPLNITIHSAATYDAPARWDVYPSGRDWRDPNATSTSPRPILQPFRTPDPLFYSESSNTLYNASQFNLAASCQQQGQVKYKWGFSFVLLYTYILAILLWSTGMYGLYLHVYLHTHPVLEQRDLGIERAALDIAAGLEPLLSTASDKHTHTNSHTGNSALRGLARDVSLSYAHLVTSLSGTTHQTRAQRLKSWWARLSLRAWAKAEKYWLGAFTLLTGLFVASFTAPYVGLVWSAAFSWLPGLGVLVVLIVGRETPSRWTVGVPIWLAFVAGEVWWMNWTLSWM